MISSLYDKAQPLIYILITRFVWVQYSSALAWAGVPLALRLVLHVAAVGSVLVGLLYNYQESLLYIPSIKQPMGQTIKTPADNPAGMRTPTEQRMPHRELRLTAADGVNVHAWFIPAPAGEEDDAPTLLFSHENAGNMGLRLQEFRMLHDQLRCNLLTYDYRGYGFSDDAPIDEPGLMLDAQAAFEWLEQAAARGEISASRVFLFGRSLGGAVTIQVASPRLPTPDHWLHGVPSPSPLQSTHHLRVLTTSSLLSTISSPLNTSSSLLSHCSLSHCYPMPRGSCLTPRA